MCQVPSFTPRLYPSFQPTDTRFLTGPRPLFADFEKIVDFHHAVEHLALASDALFGKGTDDAKTWTARHRHTLLDHDDGARRVIRALDRAAAKHRLSKAARGEVAQQRQFFVNNGDRMTYATFRARGLPIGSGPVEAAGKTLVKIRLCRSGMRWTRTGGQHILGLRTLIKSDRWTATWSRYLNTLQTACPYVRSRPHPFGSFGWCGRAVISCDAYECRDDAARCGGFTSKPLSRSSKFFCAQSRDRRRTSNSVRRSRGTADIPSRRCRRR